MSDVLADATLGTYTVAQIRSGTLNANVQNRRARKSGEAVTADQFIVGAAPTWDGSTGDIGSFATALAVGKNGLLITSGSIVLPFHRRKPGDTIETGSSHFRATGTDAFVVPQSISASAADEAGAVATLQAMLLSPDGETAPYATAVNQAVVTNAFNDEYALGGFGFGGVEFTNVVSGTVEWGIVGHTEIPGGLPYPTEYFIDQLNPRISVTFKNFDTVNTIGSLFSAMTSAVLHFRRRASQNTLVAKTGAAVNHVRCALAGGLQLNESLTASAQETGNATLVFEGNTLTTSIAAEAF